tara:strand:+ start:267 stop:647 length:381 start_codon:yes stop_codon:yes gene_type:complete
LKNESSITGWGHERFEFENGTVVGANDFIVPPLGIDLPGPCNLWNSQHGSSHWEELPLPYRFIVSSRDVEEGTAKISIINNLKERESLFYVCDVRWTSEWHEGILVAAFHVPISVFSSPPCVRFMY